jgi:lambda family phage portal protein
MAQQRMYASAIPSRLNIGTTVGFNNSADAELVASLRNLRTRSRQLVRDAAFAKSAKRIIVNNVIGTGIRLDGRVLTAKNTGNDSVNEGIENGWETWCKADSCHTGGELHFADLERLMMGQVFEAGEIFIRVHRSKFGSSQVPLALEVVEAERILEGYQQPGDGIAPGNQVRMGVECDKFQRPIAYWIRDQHPGDIRVGFEQTEKISRVPAADMFHLRIIDRWPQTRGEPWMHAIARKLTDMDGYSEAEIIAARGSASYLGTITTPEDPESLGDAQEDGTIQQPVEPGMWMRLQPGETANFVAPNRPNSALDPFMRFMLREVAAGLGTSYESLSRDYSQSNYSSSRLALLDDRDVWRVVQQWFIRSFREPFHAQWMQAATLARAIPEIDLTLYANAMEKYHRCMFRPRGWSWIDPTKEVAAYKQAVVAGFMTQSDVIAATSGGQDLEDIAEKRAEELKYFKDKGLVFDTSPDVFVPAETRGQIIVDPDTGDLEPASVVAAQAQAEGQIKVNEAKPEPPAPVVVAHPGGAAAPDAANAAATDAKVKSLSHDVADAFAQIRQIKSREREFGDQIVEHLDVSRTLIEQQKKQVAELAKALTRANAQAEQHAKAIREFQADKTQLDADIAKRFEALQALDDRRLGEIRDIGERLGTIDERILEAAQQTRSEMEFRTSLVEEIQQLQSLSTGAQQSVRTLEKRLDEATQTVADLTSRTRAAERFVERLTAKKE